MSMSQNRGTLERSSSAFAKTTSNCWIQCGVRAGLDGHSSPDRSSRGIDENSRIYSIKICQGLDNMCFTPILMLYGIPIFRCQLCFTVGPICYCSTESNYQNDDERKTPQRSNNLNRCGPGTSVRMQSDRV